MKSTSTGWIKLYRQVWDNPVLTKKPSYMLVWIYILTHAAYEQQEVFFNGRKMLLVPGQCVLTYQEISDAVGVSKATIKRVTDLLKNETQIEKRAGHENTLITVVNWERYQNNETQDETPMKRQRNADETPSYYIKNLRREEGKNVREATNIPDSVNAKGQTEIDADLLYFQSSIHPIANQTEQEAVLQLCCEYASNDFRKAVDKARDKGIKHANAWRYIDKILSTGGVKDFAKQNGGKNDFDAGNAEATKILESGELNAIFD